MHGTMSDKNASLSTSVTPRSDRSENSPSVESLQLLQQILKDDRPLAGRKVMVPVTRQAFMEGHLQPPPTDVDATAATESQSISEEKVLANLGGGQLAEMSRADAAAFIQRRIDAVTSQSSTASKMSAAKASTSKEKQPKKSALKPSSKQSAKPQPQAHTILPFFEIREEYDSSGQEVKAEAVNVANEMKALKDALRSQNTGAGGDGDDAKQIRELIETIDIGGGDDGGDVGQQQVSGDDAEAMYEEEPEQQEPVSDEQYDSLSARLNELAKMEEEAEKNKNQGQSSRQRLQGKAWGKGFLSSNGGGAAAQSQKQKTKTGKKKKNGGSGGWNTGFLNAKPKKKGSASAGGMVATGIADGPERQRKVAFGADEVKEIPRIGNTSIKAVQQMQKAGRSQAQQSQQQPVAAPQEQETEPISKEVFSGVVKERGAAAGTGTSVVISEQPPQQQQQQPPKKKLSRFAQQRLEQRGGL